MQNQICYLARKGILNVNNHLIPCGNGGHLQSGKRHECNLMYKRADSYCVPWLYVCDGKWDCSEDDELNNPVCTKNPVCVHMYKCRNTQTCLHLGNVCDGSGDCPYCDDESLCDLKNVQCPLKCNCLVLATECRNVLDVKIET